MKITKGKVRSALKVVVYGPEGIGKSTISSHFPDPVYIDTEGSTKELDVSRLPVPETWEQLLEEVDYVAANPTICKTLVIDTFDWAERLCQKSVCEKNRWSSVSEPGYGKGYGAAFTEFCKLLSKLDQVIKAGVNVVGTCHAKITKFEQPDEMGAYDRWEMKLQNSNNSNSSQAVKEWADMVLFANYKTFAVKTDAGARKAQGGKRVMYATHHPCWDAKNRFGLPDVMDFDFKEIAHLFEAKEVKKEVKEEVKEEKKPEALPYPTDMGLEEKELRDLMKKAGITEDEVIVTFHAKGKFKDAMSFMDIDDWGFIKKSVIGNWNAFRNAVEKYGKEDPFINHEA